jgi:hypothetical protein
MAFLGKAHAQVEITDPPVEHSFGKVPLGATYATQYFSVFNRSAVPVEMGLARLDGELATCMALGCPVVDPTEFSLVQGSDGCSGATLQPGQGCSTLVAFSPKVPGSRISRLVFDVREAAPISRILQGTGVSTPLDCVLDWAQTQLPQLLSAPTSTFVAAQFQARCYANGTLCIGADNVFPSFDQPSVYVLNLQESPVPVNVGYLSVWAERAQCK